MYNTYSNDELYKLAYGNYRLLMKYCAILEAEGYWEQPEQILKKNIYECLDRYIQALLISAAYNASNFDTEHKKFCLSLTNINSFGVVLNEDLKEGIVMEVKRAATAPPVLLQLCGLRDEKSDSGLAGLFLDAVTNILLAMSYLNGTADMQYYVYIKDYYSRIYAFIYNSSHGNGGIDSKYIFKKLCDCDLKKALDCLNRAGTDFESYKTEISNSSNGYESLAGSKETYDKKGFKNVYEERVFKEYLKNKLKDGYISKLYIDEEDECNKNKENIIYEDNKNKKSTIYKDNRIDENEKTTVYENNKEEKIKETVYDDDNADKTDKSNKINTTDENNKINENDETNRNGKTNREDESDRNDRTNREDESDRNERTNREDESDRNDRTNREDKSDKDDKFDKDDKSDNIIYEDRESNKTKDDIMYEVKELKLQSRLSELLEQLNSLIGLAGVKKEINSLINLIKVRKLRERFKLPAMDMSYHMVFTGNPGTGKTTVARLVAEIYKELGILSNGNMVETDRSGLVAGYVGQTALKVKEVVDKAIGGVLFIDEAYALSNTGISNDFGSEAIDALVKLMEDNRDNLVVIVAGYTKEMDKFLKSNTGLVSRFNKFIEFPDYTNDELIDILNSMANNAGFKVSKEAEEIIRIYLSNMSEKKKQEFGNARGIRNIFEKIVVNQADRVVEYENPTIEELSKITEEDVAYLNASYIQ